MLKKTNRFIFAMILFFGLICNAAADLPPKTRDLMALGMPGALAQRLGRESGSAVTFSSDTDLVLTTDADGVTPHTITFDDAGQILFDSTDYELLLDNTDGSDDGFISYCGGGNNDDTRGACLNVYGNEASGALGVAHLFGGNTTTANIRIDVRDTTDAADVLFQRAGTTKLAFENANMELAFHGNDGLIRTNTSDGSDTKLVEVNGGGSSGTSRGAGIKFHGNEHATKAGDMTVTSGNISGGDLELSVTNTGSKLSLQSAGTAKINFVTGELIMDFVGTMGDSSKDPSAVAEDDWIEVRINGSTRYIPVYAAS